LNPSWSARSRTAFGRDQPQVGLKTAAQPDAGFSVAVAQDTLGVGMADEDVHQLRGAADREDVDVAARLGAAAQAADRNQLHGVLMAVQVVDDRRGGGGGLVQEMAAGVPGSLLDRGEDLRLLLRAHALEAAQPAGARRRRQVLDAADLERGVEHRHRLRTDALQPEQLEDR
jgi:hypothetical protein